MSEPRLIGEIIAEIFGDLDELKRRYDKDCPGDVVMTCKAAANYIGKTPATISRYIAEGKLHKVCAEGIIGVRRSELLRLK